VIATHQGQNVEALVRTFNKLYHSSKTQTWKDTFWLGVPVLKCPLDLWIYQELVWSLRPDVIVETGTFKGGSAYFFATVCELIGHGRVVTIDIEPQESRPVHDRIEYVTGSSIAAPVLEHVRKATGAAATTLVVLDSDHSFFHVLPELRAYSQFVTEGSYLVVEDTNIDGVPVRPEDGRGPNEAVEAFLAETDRFERDPSLEKFFLTFNPGGFLRCVARV
jgi:cephalosporin hydroxylase